MRLRIKLRQPRRKSRPWATSSAKRSASTSRPQWVNSPSAWGTHARLEELFGETANEIRAVRREFVFRYRSAAHWIDVFRTFYGPMNKTFAALGTDKQAEFTQDLENLMKMHNRSGDRTLVLPSEYLEVVIERK